ncbi:MAG: methionine biosynthesis protein MetW [Desulfobulbus sp.]|jgi:methionine biosynthesis protein MetW
MPTSAHPETMRFDLKIIASWIEPGWRVLDLGCGNGDLLAYLQAEKQIRGTGIEQAETKVVQCIARGLTVLQGDFRFEVLDYPDHCFDVVILSQTLQQIYDPQQLLVDLLRISRRVIVSFPNFSHWKARLQVLVTGRAPITDQLPYQWYDTPNIRIISIKDFKRFLYASGMRTVKEAAIDVPHHGAHGRIVHLAANLRATYGVMMLERDA